MDLKCEIVSLSVRDACEIVWWMKSGIEKKLKSETRNFGIESGLKYTGPHLKHSSLDEKHIGSENVYEIRVPKNP